MKRKRLLFQVRAFVLLAMLCPILVQADTPGTPSPSWPLSGLREAVESLADRDGWRDLALLYELRNFEPIWGTHERFSDLLQAIEELADDGLDPLDYGLSGLRRGAEVATTHDGVHPGYPCLELEATRAYLDALGHLRFGRLDRQTLEPIWRAQPDIERTARQHQVAMLADAGLADIRTAFASARPNDSGYAALRAAYAKLRARAASPEAQSWRPVPAGPALHPGTVDTRVTALRHSLAWHGETVAPSEGEDPARYDERLAESVRRFQRANLLAPDAVVGRATIAALNVSPEDSLAKLRVNLERARWRARDMEPEIVVVDIAAARISYYRDGVPVWSARTQVGRPSRPTPTLKSEITHFTFNPTWTVPPTILRKDKLPEIRRDIEYLAKNRMRVLDRSGQELDPADIDWERPGAIQLRQDAGPENALGQVAIRFPNRFFVYLHDTPSQSQFEREARNFSSGCVRVERALELVDLMMSRAGADSGIERYLSDGRTRNVTLSRTVPILIDYWTAHADNDGMASFRPDVYRRDARILQALDDARRARANGQPCAICTSVECNKKTSSPHE